MAVDNWFCNFSEYLSLHRPDIQFLLLIVWSMFDQCLTSLQDNSAHFWNHHFVKKKSKMQSFGYFLFQHLNVVSKHETWYDITNSKNPKLFWYRKLHFTRFTKFVWQLASVIPRHLCIELDNALYKQEFSNQNVSSNFLKMEHIFFSVVWRIGHYRR